MVHGVPVGWGEPVFEKLSFGHRAEGVLAVAEMPRRKLSDLQLPERPLVAVLEGGYHKQATS